MWAMGLIDEFDAISKQISQQQQWMTTEQATINVAIHPFIRALGYDTNNLAEVRPEYTADAKSSGSERVDYAIMRGGVPVIFIEAKASNIVLNENHWKQLHHYFNAEEVRFGILTNGIEYRFYTDLNKRNIMDKEPFLTIDMLKLEERLVNELESFTRNGFDAERIIASAKIQRIVSLLLQEMDRPSEGIVKHFAGQVYSGNVNARVVQEFTPLVRAALNKFVEQNTVTYRHQHNLVESVGTRLALELEAEVIEDADEPIALDNVQIPVYAYYEGEDFTAQFKVKHGYKRRNDKVILYEGTWESVSGWAKKLKTRIHEKLNMKKAAETAGWTDFWYYKDAKRKEGPIDDFRKDPALVNRYLRNINQ